MRQALYERRSPMLVLGGLSEVNDWTFTMWLDVLG